MFGLFNSKRYTEEKAHLERRLRDQETELTAMKRERSTLKQELEDLKLKKKIEEEDIKHMVKMKIEQQDIEYEKKALALQREKDEEVAKVKDSYRDKVELQLEKRGSEIKEMYNEILQRLPNITANLEFGGKKK
ncbi:MAG: hypothetical protein ACREHG_06335 [Candidatus Saccharimonadales bacterium]